jgi:hypothetical protein
LYFDNRSAQTEVAFQLPLFSSSLFLGERSFESVVAKRE